MLNIKQNFDRLIDDPFPSEWYDGEVRVDRFYRIWVDNRHVTTLDPDSGYEDDIIETLINEWLEYNPAFK